ncbi:MAG: Holliday junction branch migration protein RuvA [Candidatus Dadabacteria bacterium]|nr:Holliday junction branch migration protein RuvA [Candidatus Dadabacteria bacterium]MDE0520197.1 Holliday junction branch migration protein RuvA [Candidatus Dadabacteria bacterium]MDE0662409.1 Holliday junction branch migration protein RuvA [Candidatus Dadabacteria bacterium]
MIYLLRGAIACKEIGTVVIDVNGVGYGVTVPLSTYYDLGVVGEEVELKIHTSQRENSIELFGFLTEAEKKLFEKLIGVSGIGPKAATNVLSNISASELVRSIINGDLAQKKIRGIGTKTATKIVNELKDKLDDLAADEESSISNTMLNDTISALLNLGYTRAEVEKKTPEIKKIIEVSGSIENVLRDSLKVIRN